MSDFMDKLWPAFFSEVSEQMQRLELTLVSASRGEMPDVNQLFRDFHTIKSSCAMMGFEGMEEIAHACEDLLDQVRNGQVELTDEHVDLLLDALETVRSQLESVDRTRLPPEPSPDMVRKLREQHASQRSNEPDTALSVEGQSEPRDDDVTESVQQPGEMDADQAVEGLAGALREALPSLLDPDPGEGADQAALAEELTKQARKLGMLAIAELVTELQQSENGNVGQYPLLATAAEFIDRIAYFTEISGADTGMEPALRELRGRYVSKLVEVACRLEEELRELDPENPFSRALGALSREALRLTDLARLLGLKHSGRLMRLCTQLLRDMERGDAECNPRRLELLDVAVRLLGEQDQHGEDETYIGICDQTLEALLGELGGDSTPDQDEDDPLARLCTQPDFPELLTNTIRKEIGAALDAGHALIEIQADLDSDPERGDEFHQWLTGNARVLNSHTRFLHDDRGESRTHIRFLVEVQQDPKVFLGELERRDPDGAFLSVHPLSFSATRPSPSAKELSEGELSAPDNDTGGAPITQGTPKSSDTLRVESARLDTFVNRVGEMVTLRNRISHSVHDLDTREQLLRSRRLMNEMRHRIPEDTTRELEVLLDHLDQRQEHLADMDSHLETVVDRLQDEVLELRVVPVSLVFHRLPPIAHRLSRQSGKEVDLRLQDNDVRIDKGMTEALVDPLSHMVRNAIDHGVEASGERERVGKPARASLALKAEYGGSGLIITLQDDGRGLDYDAIRRRAEEKGLVNEEQARNMDQHALAGLIFEPGFSTSARITETSGRGVGMDVVRTQIQQLGGSVEVDSTPGRGTTFRLQLPLSAAIQTVLLVRDGNNELAIPERNITEILEVGNRELHSVQGQAAIALRGTPIPVFRLQPLLWPNQQNERSEQIRKQHQLVVLANGEHRIALEVEAMEGRQELFMREVHQDLMRIQGIAGCAVTGKGRVVIIADCDALLSRAARNAQSLTRFRNAS